MMRLLMSFAAAGVALVASAMPPTAHAEQRRPNNKPPAWYPSWGTIISGDNIKICKDLVVSPEAEPIRIVTVTNTDETRISFKLDAGKIAQSALHAFQSACEHAGKKPSNKNYTINLSTMTGLPLTGLQGNNSTGSASVYIVSISLGTTKMFDFKNDMSN